MIVIVMGASGAGKTTVGSALAAAVGWPFHDADDFHPPENVRRMREGVALDDDDRRPWLDSLASLVRGHAAADTSIVLACSALRRDYRAVLVPSAFPDAVRFVFLRATAELLAERLARRRGHFFPPALLATQLAALEEPAAGDVEAAPVLVVDAARISATRVATGRAASTVTTGAASAAVVAGVGSSSAASWLASSAGGKKCPARRARRSASSSAEARRKTKRTASGATDGTSTAR